MTAVSLADLLLNIMFCCFPPLMDVATEKSAKVEVAVTPPSDSGPVQNGIAHNVEEEVNVFFIVLLIFVLVNILSA